jgi:hypothetical protein
MSLFNALFSVQNWYRIETGDCGALIGRNGLNIITKSLSRVAKKSSPNDIEGFTKNIMANITTTTDAYVIHPSPTWAHRWIADGKGEKL